MNTYLLPISDGESCWIEKVIAHGISEAEEKLVKYLANDFDFIDFADSFEDMRDSMQQHDFIIGDIYDIEEF